MTENAATVVGESILISGNLHGDENLTVLGRVEGSISLSKTLVVSGTGVVRAEVSVRNATISGTVVGNITATESIEVTESGRLVGDLKAPRIMVVAGAKIRGTVDMGEKPNRQHGQNVRAMVKGSQMPTRALMGERRAPPPPPAKPIMRQSDDDIMFDDMGEESEMARKLKKKIVVRAKE